MSSPITTTQVVTNTRKPTLPEKYGKFVQFAYYMMDNILGDEIQKESYLEKIKLFESVEDQQAMIQGFLDNSKENKKTIRKVIADHKKALVKEQKAIAKALAKENKPAKQPRSKKVVEKKINNAEEEVLNTIVQPTIEQTSVTEEPVIAEVEPKKAKKVTKKTTKTIAATEPEIKPLTNELIAEDFITETTEPVKPKRKKTKKNETNATTDAGILPPTTTPETNIEITPITISDTTYFKDNNSNIYSYPTPTSQPIGKYNTDTNDITLL